MATKKRHVKAIIQLRRATEPEWFQKDPVLRLGEPAYSTDVNKLKVGNGIDHWTVLEYLNDSEFAALMREIESRPVYTAGRGISLEDNEISVEDFIIDCGTSTTVI